jgi:hypothetical protein
MCTTSRRFRVLSTCSLFLVAAASGSATACGPVLATGPNAVGVHLAGVSYPSSPSDASDEVRLDYAAGARFTYSRRVTGVRKFWLGPEATVGFTAANKLSAAQGDYPDGVSRSFAVALLRLNVFGGEDWAPNITWLQRVGFDFGAGIAYCRFSETGRLINGLTNSSPRVDGGFGPAFSFGLEYQITRHVVFRTDGLGLLLEPELSFEWPSGFHHKFVGGGGIVIVF